MLTAAIAFASAFAIFALVLLGRGRRDRTSYNHLPPTGEVRRTVTLIHGTWPRGPLKLAADVEWYGDSSPLCSAIYGDGRDTLIHRFRWSGSNSMSSRL